MTSMPPRAVLLAAVAVATTSLPTGNAGVVAHREWASLHFHGGHQSLSFRLHQPAGVILLYRISAPRGTYVRAFTRLPKITVPLKIGTRGNGCRAVGTRTVCTVGEEWCPMPEGVWHVRVDKISGPAGEVRLWFRVGSPPHGYK
jgi:hypothetical protein